MVTDGGDIDFYLSGGFKYGFAFFNLDWDVIYEKADSLCDCSSLPGMAYRFWATGQDAWEFSFTADRLAWSATILDLLAMLLCHRRH